MIRTVVASTVIQHRDVFGFFKKYVPVTMYRSRKVKGMDFFSLDTPETFDQLKKLAVDNKSIYSF